MEYESMKQLIMHETASGICKDSNCFTKCSNTPGQVSPYRLQLATPRCLTTGHDEALSEVQGGTLKTKEGPGWNVEGSQEPQ